MNPLVSKVHGTEKRWSAEYAALRRLFAERQETQRRVGTQ